MTENAKSPLLTRQEAAQFMRMHLRTFTKRVMPNVARVRAGGRWFYLESDLRDYIEKGRVLPNGKPQARVKTTKKLPKADQEKIKKLMADIARDERPKLRVV